jgi:tripeptide aminopeptidase
MISIKHTVAERFLRYVRIDTQSDPQSSSFPSTEKQKDLSRLLVQELQEMGVTDAHLDEYGYVYATLPANTTKKVPVVCFCAHVDTSPDCSGAHVNPVIHRNYLGGKIVLPADTTQVLTPEDHPELLNQIGNDIITADGTTLLGADNKAGVAEIMEAAHFLMTHPEIKHGTIKILFTPDEEIGRGVDKVNLNKLGADYAYTVDGETLGHIENETFSADMVTAEISGFSTHPGYAKGKMESAIKIAAAIIESLPKHHSSPETTEGREGFVHPVSVSGTIEKTILKFIVRSFETEELKQLEAMIGEKVKQVMKSFPHSTCTLTVNEQYRNFKEVLDHHPQLIEYAMEAVQRAGVKPHLTLIRGGTDGSRLSFMGLPCPNLFAGEHAFHGKHEWVSMQDMQKATETIIHLCMIWEENSH